MRDLPWKLRRRAPSPVCLLFFRPRPAPPPDGGSITVNRRSRRPFNRLRRFRSVAEIHQNVSRGPPAFRPGSRLPFCFSAFIHARTYVHVTSGDLEQQPLEDCLRSGCPSRGNRLVEGACLRHTRFLKKSVSTLFPLDAQTSFHGQPMRFCVITPSNCQSCP